MPAQASRTSSPIAVCWMPRSTSGIVDVSGFRTGVVWVDLFSIVPPIASEEPPPCLPRPPRPPETSPTQSGRAHHAGGVAAAGRPPPVEVGEPDPRGRQIVAGANELEPEAPERRSFLRVREQVLQVASEGRGRVATVTDAVVASREEGVRSEERRVGKECR